MFGIVLKNSILMFLIILITHFFLDNSKKKLMDRYTRNTLNLIEDEATKKVVSTTPKVKNEDHAPMNEKAKILNLGEIGYVQINQESRFSARARVVYKYRRVNKYRRSGCPV